MHCVSESPYNREKWCENEVIQVFNTINNNILMAKLERYSYSCSATSLKVMQNYLRNRSQKTKVNGSFIDWTEIITAISSRFYFGASVI